MNKVDYRFKQNGVSEKLSKAEEEEILERVFDSIIARNPQFEQKELKQDKT